MQKFKTVGAVHTIHPNKINKKANELAFTFNTENTDYI